MPNPHLKTLHIHKRKIIDAAIFCRDRVEDHFDRYPRETVMSPFKIAEYFGPVLAILVVDKHVRNPAIRGELIRHCHRWVMDSSVSQYQEVLECLKYGGEHTVMDTLMSDQTTSHVAMALTYVTMAQCAGEKRGVALCARAMAELQVAREMFGYDVFKWSDSVTQARCLRQVFK